ncbi:hypothetical protein ABKV19_022234 [Rosa sericea]
MEEMKNSTEAVEKKRNDVVGESTENCGPSLMDEDDDTALEVITFSRRFPKRIESQLQKDWPMVKSRLKNYGIACQLNLVKCSMTFSTTRTRDADLIEKARNLLRLFTLAVPASQAITILKGRHWDVMKLGYQKDGLCSEFGINKEKFHERLKLLCHPSLKEIGDLLVSDICIDGDILVALGPVISVKGIRIIVKDCIVRGIPPASRVKKVKDAKVRVQTMKRLEDLLL